MVKAKLTAAEEKQREEHTKRTKKILKDRSDLLDKASEIHPKLGEALQKQFYNKGQEVPEYVQILVEFIQDIPNQLKSSLEDGVEKIEQLIKENKALKAKDVTKPSKVKK